MDHANGWDENILQWSILSFRCCYIWWFGLSAGADGRGAWCARHQSQWEAFRGQEAKLLAVSGTQEAHNVKGAIREAYCHGVSARSRHGHSETSQCAYDSVWCQIRFHLIFAYFWWFPPRILLAPCHLLDPHQDLKHCTASLTRGVVKFAQALCENHRRNRSTKFGTDVPMARWWASFRAQSSMMRRPS